MDEKQIKEIMNARYLNPKFVFDGKRMRHFTSRRIYDYSGLIIREDDFKVPKIHNSSFLVYNESGKLDFKVFDSKFITPGVKVEGFCSKNYHARQSEIETLKLKMTEDVFLSNPGMVLNLPYFEQHHPRDCVQTKMAHYSINKVKSPINVIRWTPDGKRLITGNFSGEFTLWNGFSFNFDTIMQAHESPIRGIEYSPFGSFFISSDQAGIIKYWNSCLNNVQVIKTKDAIRDLSFSPTGEKFCATGDDGEIKIFDTVTAKLESALEGHGWDVRVSKWHKEYSLIASGGKDKLIKFWDPRVKKEICTIHTHKNSLLTLSFIKDNYLISGGKDQVIKYLDIRKGEDVNVMKTIGKDVTSLTAHPFQENMFCSGAGDGSIYHWQVGESEPIAINEAGHDSTVWSLRYHPIAHILASGSADMTTRFWTRKKSNPVLEDEFVENQLNATVVNKPGEAEREYKFPELV